MSALNTLITSYTHDRGMQFNEAYSVNPTRTGTSPLAGSPAFTLTNTAPTFASTICPPGATGGSWAFTRGTSAGVSTVYGTTSTNTGETTPYQDGLFTMGFWFMMPVLPIGAAVGYTLFENSTAVNRIQMTGTTTTGTTSRFNFNFNTTTTAPSNAANTITAGQWMFVAVRKTSESTNNLKYYVNGVNVATFTYTPILAGATVTRFGGSQADTGGGGNKLYYLSNYFVGSPDVYTEAVIQNIYTTGITPPVTSYPLKYWNGSAWTTPLNKQQWNGSAWVTMNGKVWNGTQWVAIS